MMSAMTKPNNTRFNQTFMVESCVEIGSPRRARTITGMLTHAKHARGPNHGGCSILLRIWAISKVGDGPDEAAAQNFCYTETSRKQITSIHRRLHAIPVAVRRPEGTMQIGIPRETLPGEARVAATPETVKKLVKAGHTILVERNAGRAARYPDADYEQAGATLTDAAGALGCALVLKVRRPTPDELARTQRGNALLGMLDPFDTDGLRTLADAGLTAFALEAAPRTTRAQSMDVLSSQANLAGYKAVLLAAHHYGRIFPMLMTAAGTLKAARVVVLGAGVAGLQAIATARRLGAVVEASDVRPAAREQVESLGGKFIDVPFETDEEREIAQGTGGYARPMPAAWMARQAQLVAERCKQADIVITPALIPGRPAPTLIQADTVTAMKPGSVIVDLAVERGGNCPLSVAGEIIDHDGVTLVGLTNLPALLATDASALYARNVLDFLKLIVDAEGRLAIPADDDIVKACLVCQNGQVLRSA
jgi:NAD(P) transhydrogenase subunit alpha